MEMMNQEFKAKWCKALRSGDYTQGQRDLITWDGGFCCLGVAVDVGKPSVFQNYGIEGKAATEDLDEFWHEIGLSTKAISHLVGMNDDWSCSFDEIADWIEENL